MGIEFSPNPEYTEHPGIGMDTNFKQQPFKYVVTDINPDTGKEQIRFTTNHEFDLLVSTKKTRDQGAGHVYVRAEDYLRNKERDGMVIERKLPIVNLREANWKPKVQIVVPAAYKTNEATPAKGKPGRPPNGIKADE